MSKQKLAECLANVKAGGALVHNITNYVTVNDVANVILASGASPIMSDEPKDVEDITTICGGLNINIGTLNEKTIERPTNWVTRSCSIRSAPVRPPSGRTPRTAF